MLAVADAIAYAHSERIIHRDLKPTNVLVGKFGETIVIDWGLAKDLAVDDPDALDAGPYRAAPLDHTMAGAVLGTPAYMAPEQAAGEPVDERADVYALGAILYHVVSGVVPHEGTHARRDGRARDRRRGAPAAGARAGRAARPRRDRDQGDGARAGRPLRERAGSGRRSAALL